MATSLVEQREKIIARHRMLEAASGAPWHPKSLGPRAEAEDAEARDCKYLPLSQRPVAFQCGEEVVVVGPCVKAITAGLEKFSKAVEDDPTFANTAVGDAQMRQTIDRVFRFCSQSPPVEIRVSTSVWNSYAHALGEVGIPVVLTEGTLHDSPKQKAAHNA